MLKLVVSFFIVVFSVGVVYAEPVQENNIPGAVQGADGKVYGPAVRVEDEAGVIKKLSAGSESGKRVTHSVVTFVLIGIIAMCIAMVVSSTLTASLAAALATAFAITVAIAAAYGTAVIVFVATISATISAAFIFVDISATTFGVVTDNENKKRKRILGCVYILFMGTGMFLI